MARHDAGWWAQRVAELELTGDAARIARTYGVTVRHLKWWRWRLRSDGPKTSRVQTTRDLPRRAEQRLLPIVVAREPTTLAAAPAEPASTLIETTHGRITLRGALSPEQLAAVVAELVRGC